MYILLNGICCRLEYQRDHENLKERMTSLQWTCERVVVRLHCTEALFQTYTVLLHHRPLAYTAMHCISLLLLSSYTFTVYYKMKFVQCYSWGSRKQLISKLVYRSLLLLILILYYCVLLFIAMSYNFYVYMCRPICARVLLCHGRVVGYVIVMVAATGSVVLSFWVPV